MLLPEFSDNPFQVQLSFNKIIDRYENIAATETGYEAEHAKAILKKVSAHPELRDGLTDAAEVEQNAGVIANLLSDLFPSVLSLNEIKAVSLPYLNIVFNHTERFKNILVDAGPD